MTDTAPSTAPQDAPLVPAKLQKVVVDRQGLVLLEVFAGGKRWVVVRPGAMTVADERPDRDDDAEIDQTLQGLLRKELLPGILTSLDVDDAVGLIRLRVARPENAARVLVIETDAREPRWLLLAVTADGERILAAFPNTKPQDGRDTRRGRPYEPPRRAPAPATPTTTTVRPAPVVLVDPEVQQLRARLRAEHDRLKRLRKKLEGDMARHGDPEVAASRGEYLKMAMGQLRRGMATIDVVDHEGVTHVIPLDVTRDAAGNLKLLFDKARRARAARAHVAPRLTETLERMDVVDGVRTAMSASAPGPDVLEQARALMQAPQTGASARRRAATAGPRQPWRSFVVDGDIVVRVGRGAADNDALVKSARGNDLWLHARDRTGAHVVIPSSGGVVPDAVVLDAAHLAAWFSLARGERHVDIQSTRVKHLRKPGAGAPAGLFLVANETVTHLKVDPARTERLLAMEVAAADGVAPRR